MFIYLENGNSFIKFYLRIVLEFELKFYWASCWPCKLSFGIWPNKESSKGVLG